MCCGPIWLCCGGSQSSTPSMPLPCAGGSLPDCWMPNDTLSNRQRIVITVGLPGSGKSTYLERIGVQPISSDSIRQLLADDSTDQTFHARVFATIRYLLRHRLALGRPVSYIDATH